MSYLHQSAPRAVQEGGRSGIAIIESSGARGGVGANGLKKKKYRDPMLEAAEAEGAGGGAFTRPNIMFDPRVQRGSTAGKTAVIASHVAADAVMAATMARTTTAGEMKRPAAPISAAAAAAAGAKARKAALIASGQIRPSLPTAAYLHAHLSVTKPRVEVPLHLYLVEQKEDVIVVNESAQTDVMMVEAPTPAYIPRKRGVDTGTQVETKMVFEFDEDVARILEVVVSKTIEQALMEVREEEEMGQIGAHTKQLKAKFAMEEEQAEQLVRQERAKFAAKEAMFAAARQQHQQVLTIRSKLAASYFSRHYLSTLTSSSLLDLRNGGFFRAKDAPEIAAIESQFLPEVMNGATGILAHTREARMVTDQLLSDILVNESSAQVARRNAEDQRRAEEESRILEEKRLAELQESYKRTIQLFIHSDAIPASSNPVGPISFTGLSTIYDIQEKVYSWMEEHLGEGGDAGDSEGVPPRDELRFLWNGQELNKNDHTTKVHEIGIQNLATLTMERIRPPQPEKSEADIAAAAAAAADTSKKTRRVRKQKVEDEDGASGNDDKEEDSEDQEEAEEDEDQEAAEPDEAEKDAEDEEEDAEADEDAEDE